MRVVQVNYAYDSRLDRPDALLDRYATLIGWAGAIARAGADVLTVQEFHSSANVTRDGLPYTFGDVRAIVSAAAAFRPDVAHVNGLIFPARTWRLRRHLRSSVIVVQDHASDVPDETVIRRAVRRRLMAAADAFLFSTQQHAEAWQQRDLITAEQRVYAVMEASTDMRATPRDEARSLSGVTGAPALLWVGRFNANKDPLTVLAAFERFATRSPDATLTMIYQEGDLLSSVRTRVLESTTLRECVRLVGAVPHDRMAAYFSAADIFVIGSHHEGSGYALMEAIACGAVPVVTDIPSFRALMGVGVGTEWGRSPFWTPGDADACARTLADVSSRDLAAERQRMIDHFNRELTWDAVGRQALRIYDEVFRDHG